MTRNANLQAAPLHRQSILIVEDNALNLKLLVDLLEAHGYRTISTGDGLEAINLARQTRPDLILMDVQLPDVSGLEITRWLKEDERTKDIPVVAVTAFAMAGDERRARDAGCDGYIAKPIMVADFLRTITGYLGKPER
jgi:two-component system, cell cycle response regulator DivK